MEKIYSVPLEPTQEMIAAAKPHFKEIDAILGNQFARTGHQISKSPLVDAWKAMVLASCAYSEPKTCTDCGEPSFEDYDYCKEHLFLEARGI